MKFRMMLLVCVCALCVSVHAAEPAPEPDAAACILIHPETGAVLYEKNADEPLPIASTTKIMTAMIVLERCGLTDTVEILPEYTGVEGSSMYLKAGSRYTVEDLLYGMMLQSGNDAAVALACHTAGSVEAFAELMNEKAAALGLTQTHFRNPHGLDASGHGSTARELSKIAAAAMENETFRTIVSTERRIIGDQTYVNHNRLLRTYPGAEGVKTGYTMAAGRILVSSAMREGTRFLCVTIADPNDWADHAALLDWAFASYTYFRCGGVAYAVPVLSGTADACIAVPEAVPSLLLETGQRPALSAELPRFVFAPLRQGQTVGALKVTAPDGTAASIPLICGGDVPADESVPLSLPERLGRFWRLAGRALFSFDPIF